MAGASGCRAPLCSGAALVRRNAVEEDLGAVAVQMQRQDVGRAVPDDGAVGDVPVEGGARRRPGPPGAGAACPAPRRVRTSSSRLFVKRCVQHIHHPRPVSPAPCAAIMAGARLKKAVTRAVRTHGPGLALYSLMSPIGDAFDALRAAPRRASGRASARAAKNSSRPATLHGEPQRSDAAAARSARRSRKPNCCASAGTADACAVPGRARVWSAAPSSRNCWARCCPTANARLSGAQRPMAHPRPAPACCWTRVCEAQRQTHQRRGEQHKRAAPARRPSAPCRRRNSASAASSDFAAPPIVRRASRARPGTRITRRRQRQRQARRPAHPSAPRPARRPEPAPAPGWPASGGAGRGETGASASAMLPSGAPAAPRRRPASAQWRDSSRRKPATPSAANSTAAKRRLSRAPAPRRAASRQASAATANSSAATAKAMRRESKAISKRMPERDSCAARWPSISTDRALCGQQIAQDVRQDAAVLEIGHFVRRHDHQQQRQLERSCRRDDGWWPPSAWRGLSVARQAGNIDHLAAGEAVILAASCPPRSRRAPRPCRSGWSGGCARSFR